MKLSYKAGFRTVKPQYLAVTRKKQGDVFQFKFNVTKSQYIGQKYSKTDQNLDESFIMDLSALDRSRADVEESHIRIDEEANKNEKNGKEEGGLAEGIKLYKLIKNRLVDHEKFLEELKMDEEEEGAEGENKKDDSLDEDLDE